MRFVSKFLKRSLVTLFAVFGLSLAAKSETAQGDLVITAGLEQGLTVVCESDLSFGVIRVDTGLRGGGGETKIEAIFNSIVPQVTGEAEGITAALVDPGTCEVTNSLMPDNSLISISFPEFVLLTGAEVEGLDAAATSGGNEILMRVDNFDREFGTGRILENGRTQFSVGGILTVPNNLHPDNLGGYSGTITVVVDDDPVLE